MKFQNCELKITYSFIVIVVLYIEN